MLLESQAVNVRIPHCCFVYCRAVRTPSYYVQQLFAASAGPRVVSTSVADNGGQHGLAASTSCRDDSCAVLACKVAG